MEVLVDFEDFRLNFGAKNPHSMHNLIFESKGKLFLYLVTTNNYLNDYKMPTLVNAPNVEAAVLFYYLQYLSAVIY
jgi:hypothetical protein